MTARTFLVSGLLAGLIAGFAAFVIAVTIGEPPIDAAIAVEEAASAPADHSHGDEAAAGHSHADDEEEGGITREQQAGFGLLTATLVFGVVLGGVAGIAAAFLTGRIGRLSPAAAGWLAAGLGFLTFALVPFLKYPANPPAVGSSETIGERTAWYFVLVAIAVVAIAVALYVVKQVQSRSTWTAIVAGFAVYAVVIGIAYAALPTINEVPDSFPANTLYDFRIGSLLTQSTLWLAVGVALSGLLARAWRTELETNARRELAASL